MQISQKLFSIRTLFFFLIAWLPMHVAFGQGIRFHLDWLWLGNAMTLIVLLIGSLGCVTVLIFQSSTRLWYPITWFLFTTGIYYGFGPLLYYGGTTQTIAYVDQFFPVLQADLHRVNTLVLVGVSSVLAAYQAAEKIFGYSRSYPNYSGELIANQRSELWLVVTIFLLIGAPVKFFLQLPYAFGLTSFVLPGIFTPLAHFATLSLVPLFILFRIDSKRATLPFFAVLIAELLIAFMSLSKLTLFEVVLVLVLAGTVTGWRGKKIVLTGFLLIAIYVVFLSSFVLFARNEFRVTGLTSLSDTRSAITEYFTNHGTASVYQSSQIQEWWARLNYAPAQAFSMRAYDFGYNGKTFELIPYVLVPRIFYPDKPVLTTGAQFNYMVNGNPDSHSSPTSFGEAYWNGGWLAVVLMSLGMGFLYWLFEVYTWSRLASFRLEFLPVLWIVLVTGIQHDSWFVPLVIGGSIFALAFHVCIAFFIAPVIQAFRHRNIDTRRIWGANLF